MEEKGLVSRISENAVLLHEGRLVMRSPKLGFWSFFGVGGRDLGEDEVKFARGVIAAAIREALEEVAANLERSADELGTPDLKFAARLIRSEVEK